MSATTIAPESWREELDSFSRQYESWLVSIITRSADGTVDETAHDVPLHGVTLDAPHSNRINVDVGGPDGQLIHQVSDVCGLTIEYTPARATRALVLDSRDGTKTTVAFRVPARPEEVDGLPVHHR